VAISGGPDSVYLLHHLPSEEGGGRSRPLLLHMNHKLRGGESDADQRFVESLAESLGLPVAVGESDRPGDDCPTGIESRARAQRYAFIRKTCAERGIRRVLVAHTADDQVETVLMRIFEGAGVSGLKGIPLVAEGGIERPLLNMWRREIVETLDAAGHPYRTDSSNLDTRFERNWVRHVLLPMLVERYGEPVRKRIHALGERFRELDGYILKTAANWIRRNVKGSPPTFRRSSFAALPSPVRIAVLQQLLLAHARKSANERLLTRLDGMVISGKPSASVHAGNRTRIANRYERVAILRTEEASSGPEPGPGLRVAIPEGAVGAFHFDGKFPATIDATEMPASKWRKMQNGKAARGRRDLACFDPLSLRFPLAVAPLAAGDTITPFGGIGSRKVKEIMIDLKIPRESRWGRATVRDASGRILWIPGVVRSDIAPVDERSGQVLCLAARSLC
jgi:tRNA(Ile)-lysidine synthetase-like protein